MRVLFWFRKDLRLDDNTGLHAAAHDAKGGVVPWYHSDPAILGRPDIAATRVRFALDSLADLAAAVEKAGSRLALDHGDPVTLVPRAATAAQADAVYWNDEYEPSLRRRDDAVQAALEKAGVRVKRFHDRLLVPPDAVRTGQGGPYTVYSPFRRACEALPISEPLPAPRRLAPHEMPVRRLAALEDVGFAPPTAEPWPGGATQGLARLEAFVRGLGPYGGAGLPAYADRRDEPATPATSRLSADLKFGTVGIRRVAQAAMQAAREDHRLRGAVDKFVSELRWRDFYHHVLVHHPHVETNSFRNEFDRIRWRGTDAWFDAWCEGRTGYPIVDAGMRELFLTGYMHNRVRMIVASFLTKDLLISWQRGERHFMRHLVDGDLANNNGGWQWAAGCGTDAAPYFRVFNPVLQSRRFDPGATYVKRWVPELAELPSKWAHAPWEAPPLALAEAGVTLGETYPAPIVDHAEQREACLEMYAAVKG